MTSVKGKLFEFFVCKLLLFCGFQPISPDGLLIYNGTAGTMVQGLGQPHNADVLLSPPIQTPFYFPTRLLVECKCYDDSIGLPVIRNALGLREDINSFDIVTEQMLKNRQSPRSSSIKYHPMKRYAYQVAVASMSGFKSTAIPFAQAHRIPLISFSDSALFANIRNYINEIELCAQENSQYAEKLLVFLGKEMHTSHADSFFQHNEYDIWNDFIEELLRFQRLTTVGLLDDGTIIFLIQQDSIRKEYKAQEYSDGYSIHWSHNSSAWELRNQNHSYYFELPNEIYNQWKRNLVEQRAEALKIKQNYLSQIVLFNHSYQNGSEINIIRLSEQFMNDARRGLDKSEF